MELSYLKAQDILKQYGIGEDRSLEILSEIESASIGEEIASGDHKPEPSTNKPATGGHDKQVLTDEQKKKNTEKLLIEMGYKQPKEVANDENN